MADMHVSNVKIQQVRRLLQPEDGASGFWKTSLPKW